MVLVQPVRKRPISIVPEKDEYEITVTPIGLLKCSLDLELGFAGAFPSDARIRVETTQHFGGKALGEFDIGSDRRRDIPIGGFADDDGVESFS
jgi:hypothetical protein